MYTQDLIDEVWDYIPANYRVLWPGGQIWCGLDHCQPEALPRIPKAGMGCQGW